MKIQPRTNLLNLQPRSTKSRGCKKLQVLSDMKIFNSRYGGVYCTIIQLRDWLIIYYWFWVLVLSFLFSEGFRPQIGFFRHRISKLLLNEKCYKWDFSFVHTVKSRTLNNSRLEAPDSWPFCLFVYGIETCVLCFYMRFYSK